MTGTLVDLSEYGALLNLPQSRNISSYAEFDLHWDGTPVRLQGRVVRCVSIGPDERAASAEPARYHVAVEFDLEARQTMRLEDLIRRARESVQ